MENERIYYCSRCIDYLKTQGIKIWVGGIAYEYEEAEEEDKACEWCEEIDELFEVRF